MVDLAEIQVIKKKSARKQIPFRMNILFFSIFVLFSILIIRLGYIQIVQSDFYTQQVNRNNEIIVSYPVPRGEIYDRNHNLVVYNIPERSIIFTPPKNPQPRELLELAKKLANYITMDQDSIDKVRERDLKDLWLLENNNGNELITKEENEKLKKKELTDQDIYMLKLERITDEHLSELDLNIAAIYRKMSTAMAFTPTTIKNKDVTDIEFATVSENLANLPGIDVTTDWKRRQNFDDTLWNILGTVTTEEQGLPSDKLDYHVSKGLKLNDRVGKSYIEELYNDLLQGVKKQVKTITDTKGNVINSKVITEGQAGKDLVLTIDMNFQAEVEKILKEELLIGMSYPQADTLTSGFVVAMNPKTGEILAMAGKSYNKDREDFDDYTPGTFNAAFEVGSAVKGATVLTGYQTGVLKIGEVIRDEPLNFKNTPPMKSWKTMGLINDLKALEQSSNVYMWKTIMKIMGGGNYVPYAPISIDPKKIETVRYYFNQFGLGVPTGIGFKNETSGIKGNPSTLGTYLHIGIGQLDTYTPMQLAQYVSTIANGGYRMKPQLVKEIRDHRPNGDELGNLVDVVKPVILNRIDMNEEMIERVQQGFWLVTHRGTAQAHFSNEPYNPAGKTGTAETYATIMENGKMKTVKTLNITFVGYAPFDDPEIAISVVVPHAYRDTAPSNRRYSAANSIARRVFRAYFNMKYETQDTDTQDQDNNTEEENEEQNINENQTETQNENE